MTQQKLYDLLIKNDKPFISGEWGKHTFYKRFFQKNELSKKQIAYVSLFGHNSFEDFKYVSKFKGAVFKDEDVTLSLDGGSIVVTYSK